MSCDLASFCQSSSKKLFLGAPVSVGFLRKSLGPVVQSIAQSLLTSVLAFNFPSEPPPTMDTAIPLLAVLSALLVDQISTSVSFPVSKSIAIAAIRRGSERRPRSVTFCFSGFARKVTCSQPLRGEPSAFHFFLHRCFAALSLWRRSALSSGPLFRSRLGIWLPHRLCASFMGSRTTNFVNVYTWTVQIPIGHVTLDHTPGQNLCATSSILCAVHFRYQTLVSIVAFVTLSSQPTYGVAVNHADSGFLDIGFRRPDVLVSFLWRKPASNIILQVFLQTRSTAQTQTHPPSAVPRCNARGGRYRRSVSHHPTSLGRYPGQSWPGTHLP